MDTAVIAGISHKGGTGRSVTLANLAFHLHYQSHNVCIVDLDLASPTMGSVLEIPGLERGQSSAGRPGSPKSVHDVLLSRDDPTAAIVDIRNKSSSIIGKHNPSKQFSLLPGLAEEGDWPHDASMLEAGLRSLIERLRGSDYHYILLDVRSGVSKTLDALNRECSGLIDQVLVHFRWTPQQLRGVESLLRSDCLENFGAEKIKFIRTAFANPGDEAQEIREFASDLDRKLRREFGSIDFNGQSLDPNKNPVLGTVPVDPQLRWKECVLVEEEGVSSKTYRRFQEIAKNIVDSLRG